MLRIGLVQMRCEKGALAENLEETARYIDEAEKLGIDIIAFPEASITGYHDPSKYPDAVLALDGDEVASAVKLTEGRNLTVLAGITEKNPDGKPFTTHIVARGGKLMGHYRKVTMADDDAEWFSKGPADEIPVFRHDDITFGLSICADIGNEEVFAECARQGAGIVFEVAAPGLYGEQATRDWRFSYEWWEGECLKYLPGYAKKYNLWIPVATQAGRTVDEDFPGGGYLFAPDGRRVYATEDWQPGVVYLAIDPETGRVEEIERGN